MADKLIIEIDGDSSGFNRALNNSQSRLNTFNTKVSDANKKLTGLITKFATGANSVDRLTKTVNKLNTEANATSRAFVSVSTKIGQLSSTTAKANAALKSTSTEANKAAGNLTKLSSSGAAVNNLFTSMGRRMTALNATISSLNTALRGVTNNIQRTGTVVGGTTTIVNRYSSAVARAGTSSMAATGGLFALNRANVGLAENFRRTVAQITALRTITYQALFWFAPLIYSIIQVNAAYERQMVLLKNVSKATTDAAKEQEAAQSRAYLVNLANNSPFALEALTSAFVRFKVAGIDPVGGSLQVLLDSISAFGGGTAELDRATVAIQQMAGKGVISMEELRQQLGEHIPDATSAMADGLGMTMGELFKTIETGTLESTTALAAMFEVLKARHSGSASEMMNTWQGLTARLATTWQNFLVKITNSEGENSFMDKLKEKVEQLIVYMNTADGEKLMRDIQRALGAVLEAFSIVTTFVVKYREEIVSAAKIFALLWGGSLIIGTLTRVAGVYGMLFGAFTRATRALTGFNVTGGITRARMAGITSTVIGTNRAAALFGTTTTRANTSLRALNATGGLSISRLAGMAAGAIAGQLAFLALAAGIMAAVYALQQYNRGVENRNALENAGKRAEEGGSFNDANDRQSQLNSLTRRERRLEQAEASLARNGGARATVPGEARSMSAEQVRAERAAVDVIKRGFQAAEANWQRDNSNRRNSQAATVATERTDAVVDRATKPFNDRLAALEASETSTTEQRLAVVRQRNEAEQRALRQELGRVNAQLNGGTSGALTATQRLAATEQQRQITERLASAELGGESLGNPEYTTAPGGGREARTPATPSDGLDGLRSRYETTSIRAAELENALDNLMGRTDETFNQEDAQDRAQREVIGLNEQQLESYIATKREYIEITQRTIQIEEGILDLRTDIAEQDREVQSSLEELANGYVSVTTQVAAYGDRLRDQYDTEILAAEAERELANSYLARAAAGETVASSEIEWAETALDRYAMLQTNLEKLIDKYRALSVIQAGMAAKEFVEDYDDRSLTNSALRLRDISESEQRVRDAIAETNLVRQEQIAIIETGDEAAAMAAEERIRSVQEVLPYLERQLQILQDQRAIEELGPLKGALANWADSAQQTTDQMKESFGNLLGSSMDGFIDDLSRGKLAFGDFVKSLIVGLVKIIIRALIAKAILSALGLGGAGGSGGGIAMPSMNENFAVAHTGGIAGGSLQSRSANAAMFNFAQRYHTGGVIGLQSNEVPIIAEKGEGVFTKEQMKAMGGSKAGPNVEVNVINQTGTEAQVERQPPKFDGEKWVESIILKKMTQAGPVRSMMRGGK